MSQPPTIVALGEVLWDLFPDGERLGGAPANFACHAAMLGARSVLVSQVGADARGEAAVAALAGLGVDVRQVSRTAEHPTGTVEVSLDALGKPRFVIIEHVAWDHLSWSDQFAELATRADAVAFGTLGQRSGAARATIGRFIAATRPDCLRLLDVNLRQHFYSAELVRQLLAVANVLKLSDDELPVIAEICGLRPADPVETARELARKFELRLVALTLGADGAVLLAGNELARCGAPQVKVRDTVGAGDAFAAALVVDLLRGRPLAEICTHATEVAAYVCSQSGATPRLPAELCG